LKKGSESGSIALRRQRQRALATARQIRRKMR
jgi:hypothetical protein